MVHDLPLKDDFKRLHSLFPTLSIVSNIGGCMMSINMFKLAARDLRHIIPRLLLYVPSLKCHVSSTVAPGECGFETDREKKTNS